MQKREKPSIRKCQYRSGHSFVSSVWKPPPLEIRTKWIRHSALAPSCLAMVIGSSLLSAATSPHIAPAAVVTMALINKEPAAAVCRTPLEVLDVGRRQHLDSRAQNCPDQPLSIAGMVDPSPRSLSTSWNNDRATVNSSSRFIKCFEVSVGYIIFRSHRVKNPE